MLTGLFGEQLRSIGKTIQVDVRPFVLIKKQILVTGR